MSEQTVIAKFTAPYVSVKKNPETGITTRKVLFNYVIIDGDVDTYSEDKASTDHLSLEKEGEFAGKPRFVSTKDLGLQVELTRREKKIDGVGTGVFEWYSDDLAEILENQMLNELPDFAKAEVAKDLVAQARAKAQATLANVRAMKARVTPVVNSTVNPDLTGM
jgi:hypothetical protein